MKLVYGSQSALNADLSPAKAFELEVEGDMDNGSPLRPVPLTVSVLSGGVTTSATVTLEKTDAGMTVTRVEGYAAGRNRLERIATSVLGRVLPHTFRVVARTTA